jgi:lipoprotein-releasing system ATP-binding protein
MRPARLTSEPTRGCVVRARRISREFLVGDTSIVALHECDVDVNAGEMLVIVGKSGSGKSTLCNVLSGIDRPTSGTVKLLGHNLSTAGDSEMALLRATQIGFVLQRDNLVPWLTIEENVAAPLIFSGVSRKAALRTAREYLELTGISHRSRSWPPLVSGGEAQRAAVARACVSKPAVVFADEPTGALDQHNGVLVRELFQTLIAEHNAAGVLVTHDPDLADDADRVVHMADGHVQLQTADAET